MEAEVLNTNTQINLCSTENETTPNNTISNNNESGSTEINWKKQSIPNLKSKTSNILKRPFESKTQVGTYENYIQGVSLGVS